MDYVERDIRERFQKVAKEYKIIALVGARQSGKTTFLKNHLGSSDEYVLFDDPDVREMFKEDVKKFESQYLSKRVTVLDEVQYGEDAGRKLKYLADSGYNLWVTSSSEVILSKDILSYLVGRVSIIKMYPFSIREFLSAKKQRQTTKRILQRSVFEHCVYGGYPKLVTTDDRETKKIILGDLYQTMILKDIAKTFGVDDIESLEKFVKYLSHSVGGAISYHNISSTLDISFQTVRKYLNAIEKSYLIFRCSPFYKNKIKEISKQPKVYFIDTGVRNYIAKDSEISGSLFENYVLSELLKSGHSPRYWRTKSGSEVDFVVEGKEGIVPIEVKLNYQKRIPSGLKRFIEEYKPKKAMVVNYEGVNEERIDGQTNCKLIYTDVLGLNKI